MVAIILQAILLVWAAGVSGYAVGQILFTD